MTKKRLKFKFKFKLSKKQKLLTILIAVLIVVFTIGITFSKYIYDIYKNHILESQGFYFNSSVMSMTGSNHSINNWDGVSPYRISIDVNNRKNDLVYTKSDISYDIGIECSSNIRCTLSKTSGIIRSETQTDSYVITIYPNGNFTRNQTAVVKTSAKSTYPYVKELSTEYSIGITTSSFYYSIKDAPGEKYLTLELTNAFTYYKVVTAFGEHNVGDNIAIDDYEKLSDEEKKNCFSASVDLTFDPNIILLDMTEQTYITREKDSQTTEVINDHNYVNGFSFDMEASSNTKIIFYKNDSSKDYSYPGTTDSSIKVSVTSVEDLEN